MQQSVVELIVVFLAGQGVTTANIANGTFAMSVEDAKIAERHGNKFSTGARLIDWLTDHDQAELADERPAFWDPHTRQMFADVLGMVVTFVVLVGDKEQNIFERSHLPQ